MDIKKIRQSKNWSQKQMGQYLGCSEAQVCYLENGKRKLTRKQTDLLKEIDLIRSLEDKVDGLSRLLFALFATPDNHKMLRDVYEKNTIYRNRY